MCVLTGACECVLTGACVCVLTVTYQLHRQSTVGPSAHKHNTVSSCCIRHNIEGIANFCYANDCTFLQGWVDRISIYFRLGSVCLTARGCSSLPGELCRARVATRVQGSKGADGVTHSPTSLAAEQYDYTNCINMLRAALLHRLYNRQSAELCRVKMAAVCRKFLTCLE